MQDWTPPDAWRTERLLIRAFRPGDGARCYEAVEASRAHLAPWMPWVHTHQSPFDSEGYAREAYGHWMLRKDFALVLLDPTGQRQLGSSGFHLRRGPLSSGNAEIGMWIRAEEAGRGLGRHALSALLDWGFSAWPWHRLEWRCDPANVPSRKVAEACGLHFEGIARQDAVAVDGSKRDSAVYAMIKPDWRAKRG